MKSHFDQLPRPLAFVFSGGASLGALQVGQAKALLEQGFVPDLMVGTSVGAINAAFLAADFSARGVKNLEGIWRGLRSNEIFGTLGLSTVMRVLRGQPNLSNPRGLIAVLENLEADFKDLPIPTFVVSVNYLRGNVVEGWELEKGRSGQFRDSSCIPGSRPQWSTLGGWWHLFQRSHHPSGAGRGKKSDCA